MRITIKEETFEPIFIDVSKLNRDTWYLLREAHKNFIAYISDHAVSYIYVTDTEDPKQLQCMDKDKFRCIQAREIKSITIEI